MSKPGKNTDEEFLDDDSDTGSKSSNISTFEEHIKPESIVIAQEMLSNVASFKAIVAPGKPKPLLDKNAHEKLVKSKFEVAREMEGHITLFRVADKKTLPPKEIKEHTVPGPQWTPPSSVGFVLGGVSQGHRIWLATEPSGDEDGFTSESGGPAIYAREVIAALCAGYLSREHKKGEVYGKTDRTPTRVLTPPSSPKDVDSVSVSSIMDVNKGWCGLPMSLDQLLESTNTISCRVQKYLDGYEVDPLLLNLGENKNIFPLIEDGTLWILEMTDMAAEELHELLLNKTVLSLLKGGQWDFKKLVELYNFMQEYSDDVSLPDMLNYFIKNIDLYNHLIIDDYNLIDILGINEFIRRFRDKQARIEKIPDDDPGKMDYNPYESLISEVEKEGGYDYSIGSEDDEVGVYYDDDLIEEALIPAEGSIEAFAAIVSSYLSCKEIPDDQKDKLLRAANRVPGARNKILEFTEQKLVNLHAQKADFVDLTSLDDAFIEAFEAFPKAFKRIASKNSENITKLKHINQSIRSIEILHTTLKVYLEMYPDNILVVGSHDTQCDDYG